MVESLVSAHLVKALNRTCLPVGSPIHNAADPGIDQCTGTHQAGFKGDVEGTISEPPVPHDRRRITKREDFGVRGRIAVQLSLVVPTSYDNSVSNNDCPDRHIIMNQRGTRLLKRDIHEFPIDSHTRAATAVATASTISATRSRS